MVLQNFVTLQDGVPAVMHFTDVALVDKVIVDPQTLREKSITVQEWTVDTLNGQKVNAIYSVTSEKLALQLVPWSRNENYKDVFIIITRTGQGFRTEYEVRTAPRTVDA